MTRALSRRSFLALGGAAACAGGCRGLCPRANGYSVSILGDTHFDAAPRHVYHQWWVPRHADDWRDRQNEFSRNAEMWADRLPRLVAAAARTRRADAAFLLQMGDLVQGDCSDFATQLRMFRDARAACTRGMEDLPFRTVCGNHDIRCGGDRAFDAFAGRSTYLLEQGADAFVFVDFMRPDAARIDALLDACAGARHTFFVLHSPIAPSDTWGSYWFLLGKPADAELRRALFDKLLRRRAIVLCGHLHRTQIRRWRRASGEIVEFCMNSVWRPQEDTPKTLFNGVSHFGEYVKAHPSPMDEDHDGCRQKRTVAEQFALVEEYRPGLVQFEMLQAAGHYQLRVADDRVEADFFSCDACVPTRTFDLRPGA